MSGCICPSGDGCAHAYPCPEPITDAGWGPWCAPCNEVRFARINKGFADIQGALEASEDLASDFRDRRDRNRGRFT